MLLDATEQIERSGEVVRPDVAPVDDARRQPFVRREAMLRDEIEVLRAPHEIEPDAIDRQRGQRRVGLADVAVGGLHQQLGGALRLGQDGVGARRRQRARPGCDRVTRAGSSIWIHSAPPAASRWMTSA